MRKTKPHKFWLQGSIFIMVIFLGMYFRITSIEWGMIMLASGLVLASEAFSYALESEMAIGAGLISCVTAATLGICIFGPHIY